MKEDVKKRKGGQTPKGKKEAEEKEIIEGVITALDKLGKLHSDQVETLRTFDDALTKIYNIVLIIKERVDKIERLAKIYSEEEDNLVN